MESSLVTGISKDSRKVLGSNPTRSIENKIDKLSLYESKNSFKGFNLKHVENLLQLDYSKISPSDFIIIFNLLTKNLYFDDNLYRTLYKALLAKVTYFNFEELLSLFKFIEPFASYRLNLSFKCPDIESKEDPNHFTYTHSIELDTYKESMEDITHIQGEILIKAIEVLDNKLKFNTNLKDLEVFYTNSSLLNILNRLSFLNIWGVLFSLGDYINKYLVNGIIDYNSICILKQIPLKKILESINYVSDTLSLKVIDLISTNFISKKLKYEDFNLFEHSTSTLLENRDLLFKYFSKEDIQVLNFVVKYFVIRKDLPKSDDFKNVNDINKLSDLSFDLKRILVFFRDSISSSDDLCDFNLFFSVNFKLMYSIQFLKEFVTDISIKQDLELVSKEITTIIFDLFLPKFNKLNSKNRSCLLSILSDLKVKDNDFKNKQENLLILDVVRDINSFISRESELSSLDCLNVLESSYNGFGYINHYSCKILIDKIIKKFPRNLIDASVIMRSLIFTDKLPFNLVWSHNNVHRSIELVLGSFKTDFPYSNSEFNLMREFKNKKADNSKILSHRIPNKCNFDNLISPSSNVPLKNCRPVMYILSNLKKFKLLHI